MSRCRVCNYMGKMKEYEAVEMMYGTRESFTYMRCPKCDCLQIKNIPDNLGKYYENDYYSFHEVDSSKHEVKDAPDQIRILDVGCGAGKRLCEIAKMGYKHVYGCDPFIEKDITYENGVKIYKKSIHEMEGTFDLIMMMDSFEHMTDPHEVLESVRRLLSPIGNVYINIPVFPNIAFDMFGTNWYQLDAPRHIYLQSRKSMHYLAKKHQFDIIQENWDSENSQIYRSFLYTKGVSLLDQTPEIIEQCFSNDELQNMTNTSNRVNEQKYGDHAMFILGKKEIEENKNPNKKYNVLLMTTPNDFIRVKKHYKMLLKYLSVKKLVIVGSHKVGEMMDKEEWESEVEFLDEDKLIPFDAVNEIMKKRLGIEDVPRGITGWYYQQFLKMEYARNCEDTYYMTWDGDTVPCKQVTMFDSITGKPYLDVKREYHEDYFITMEKLVPGLKKCIEYSFISEHMLFECKKMQKLMDSIMEHADDDSQTFYERILNVIPREKLTENSFSEFETYGSFIALTDPESYRIRRWYSFRHCGDFFDPDEITENDFDWLSNDFHAVTFEKGSFVREDNKELFIKEEYRAKLSARQILEIVQEEYLDGYKETWD